MESVFAFVCDFAQASGGKINALGIGFDTFYASEVPHTHRQFFLVMKLRADAVEAGEKDLKISLIDADGKDVIKPITGRMGIPKPSGRTDTMANLTVGFDNVKFQDYGSYALHVVIQGLTLERIPLSVAPPPTTS